MAGSHNLSSRRWVTDQYDRYVRGGTVPGPALGLRHDPDRRGNRPAGWRCPWTATAATANSTLTRAPNWRWPRRTATSPSAVATPIAVTKLPQLRLPEDPGVMWQFEQAVRGLADGCVELGIPSPAKRQLLTTRPAQSPHPPHAGGRRAGRHRRRPPTYPHRDRCRRRRDPSCFSLDPRRVRRIRVGPRRARQLERPAPSGGPRPGEAARRDPFAPVPATALVSAS